MKKKKVISRTKQSRKSKEQKISPKLLYGLLVLIAVVGVYLLISTRLGSQTNTKDSSNDQLTVIPAVSSPMPVLNEKVAFIRDGNIWIGNDDGSQQERISNRPDQSNCQYYVHNTDETVSPWSNDRKQIAYYCDQSKESNTGSNIPMMYVYNLSTKQTETHSMMPYRSSCPGCAGMGANFNLLVDNPNWQKPFDSNTILSTMDELFPHPGTSFPQIDRIDLVGGSIYKLFPDSQNAPSNPDKDFMWLYDLSQKKILYRWNWEKGIPQYSSNGKTYSFTVLEPDCHLSPSHDAVACDVILVDNTYENVGRLTSSNSIHQLLIIYLSNSKTKSIYSSIPFNPTWSEDGSKVYVTAVDGIPFGSLSTNETNKTRVVAVDKGLTRIQELFKNASNSYSSATKK